MDYEGRKGRYNRMWTLKRNTNGTAQEDMNSHHPDYRAAGQERPKTQTAASAAAASVALRRVVCDKGYCSQECARCQSHTTRTIRRTSPSTLPTATSQCRQMDTPDSALTLNGPVWLPGRTSFTYTLSPNGLLDDMTSNSFASVQGDSRRSSIPFQ